MTLGHYKTWTLDSRLDSRRPLQIKSWGCKSSLLDGNSAGSITRQWKYLFSTGVWIQWTGTVEWNGRMDWTGMEWNAIEGGVVQQYYVKVGNYLLTSITKADREELESQHQLIN